MKIAHRKSLIVNRVLLTAIAYCLLFTAGYAQGTPSTELINNAKTYDGKTVIYEGEVIGDVMARGDFAWVNLNDGKNAIGIWMDKGSSAAITYEGNYKAKGDLLQVTGIFHRSCPEHGGDLDIHAQKVLKIGEGKPRPERFNTAKAGFAAILLGALCLVLILRLLANR